MANLPRTKCRLPRACKPKAKEPVQIDWSTKEVKAVKVSILEKPRAAVSDAKWVQSASPKAHIPRSKQQFLLKATGLPIRKVAGGSGELAMGRSFVEDDSYVNVNINDYSAVTPPVRKAKVATEQVRQILPAPAPALSPTAHIPTPALPSIKSPRPLCILCILKVVSDTPCGHQGQPGGPPAEMLADARIVKGRKALVESPVVCCDGTIGTTSGDSSEETPPASTVLSKVSAPPVRKSSIGVGTDDPIVPPPKVMVDASVQAVGAPAQTQYEAGDEGDDEVDSEMTEEQRKKAIKRMIDILQASLDGDQPALDIGEERFVLDFLRIGARERIVCAVQDVSMPRVRLPRKRVVRVVPVKSSDTPASPPPITPPPTSTPPPPITRLALPRVRTSLVRPRPLTSTTNDPSIPTSSSKESAKAPVNRGKGVGRDPTPIAKPSRVTTPVLSPGAAAAARVTTQGEIIKTGNQIKASGIPLRSPSGRGVRQLEVRTSDMPKAPEFGRLQRHTGSGLKSTNVAKPTSQQAHTSDRSTPTAPRNGGPSGNVNLRATTRKWADPVANQTGSNASNAPIVDFNNIRSNLRRVSPPQGKENNTPASTYKAAPAPFRRVLRPVNGPKNGQA